MVKRLPRATTVRAVFVVLLLAQLLGACFSLLVLPVGGVLVAGPYEGRKFLDVFGMRHSVVVANTNPAKWSCIRYVRAV